MKTSRLTSERISQLALELAMISSQRTLGLADVQSQQIAQALQWHRQSCRPLQLVRRLYGALASRRLIKCLGLIADQKAMLRMAADDGCDDGAVLVALVELYDALVRFDLGPHATPKQRLALEICRIPQVRARFALLVRMGEIANTSNGLTLIRAKHRKIGCYAVLAMAAGLPALLFITLAVDGKLNFTQLAGYLTGTVVFAFVMTRGLFAELKFDERTVRDLNEQLKPRPVVVKASAK